MLISYMIYPLEGFKSKEEKQLSCHLSQYPPFCESFTQIVPLPLLLPEKINSKSKKTNIQHVNLSLVMRKPAFCNCENKDADQLRGNREADQRLCFRYTDSTIPLLPKSKISSFYLYSVFA